MGGIHHHGQVAHPLHGRDGGHVQGVAGVGLKGADAPLAEDHVLVALGHDILRRHDPLLVAVGEAPLEKDGLGQLAHLLQKVEVLHIPGADLDDIHLVLEDLAVLGAHQLGDDGHARGGLGLQQQVKPADPHPLEGVGGGAGLEGPAPEKGGPGGLHILGHRNDLLLALHRTGPRDNGEVAPADGGRAHLHHCVLRMELPVGPLVGFADPHDPLDVLIDGNFIDVDGGGVSHQAQDGAVHTVGDAHLEALELELRHQFVDLPLLRARFHNDDHKSISPSLE